MVAGKSLNPDEATALPSVTQPLIVKMDPRVKTTPAALLQQFTGRQLGFFEWMKVGVPVFVALLVAFALAERSVIHVRVGKELYSCSLDEIPFIVTFAYHGIVAINANGEPQTISTVPRPDKRKSSGKIAWNTSPCFSETRYDCCRTGMNSL